jgi:hypothetical protein
MLSEPSDGYLAFGSRLVWFTAEYGAGSYHHVMATWTGHEMAGQPE